MTKKDLCMSSKWSGKDQLIEAVCTEAGKGWLLALSIKKFENKNHTKRRKEEG